MLRKTPIVTAEPQIHHKIIACECRKLMLLVLEYTHVCCLGYFGEKNLPISMPSLLTLFCK